eukprot:4242509-Pyramimonas_sp.AAC.1
MAHGTGGAQLERKEFSVLKCRKGADAPPLNQHVLRPIQPHLLGHRFLAATKYIDSVVFFPDRCI